MLRHLLLMVSDREAGEASTFEEDWAYFEASRAELSKHYEGKFIAIKNKVVVDSDSEFSPLADRVYNKYGYIGACPINPLPAGLAKQ